MRFAWQCFKPFGLHPPKGFFFLNFKLYHYRSSGDNGGSDESKQPKVRRRV
jgi:hypothetical protein